MLRRTISFGSALSLLLCAFIAALWVRSMYRADVAWSPVGPRLFCDADSESGKIGLRILVGYGWHEPPRWRSFPVDIYDGRFDGLPSIGIRTGEFRRWRRFGMWGDYGLGRAVLEADGTVKRLGEDPTEAESGPMRYWAVEDVPLWVPWLVTSLLPLIRLFSMVRSARRRSGACDTCGYDLLATPDRCPECGTPASLKAKHDAPPV